MCVCVSNSMVKIGASMLILEIEEKYMIPVNRKIKKCIEKNIELSVSLLVDHI